ncbi:MAG: hypothetical protein RIG84_13445 [Roseovarius sp.]
MARKTTSSRRSSKKDEAAEEPVTEPTSASGEASEAEGATSRDTLEDPASEPSEETGETSAEPDPSEPAEDSSSAPEPEPEAHEALAAEELPEAPLSSEDTPEHGTDTQEDAEDQTTPEEPPIEEAKPATSPQPPVEQVVVRQGRFVPFVIGGIVAGLIGFGAGSYLSPGLFGQNDGALETFRTETRATLDEQAKALADLRSRLEAASPDLAPLQDGQAGLEASIGELSQRLDTVQTQAESLAERVGAIEQGGISANVSDEAIAGYEDELKRLQEAMATQRAEIEQMTAEARALEQSAEETAEATMRRAALSRIQTALDAGGGFADALADLQAAGVEPPAALQDAAQEGIATLAELQASFPDAARAALAAARDAEARSGETGGASAFLRNVLGVRSLEPREGDDADAILSRAEAALRDNRLNDALAEIGTLPPEAASELEGWAADASQRLEAVAAAQKLGEELN